MIAQSRWAFFLMGSFALAGCSSPESITKSFCKAHSKGDFAKAYEMLSNRDKAEISRDKYTNFKWDQQTFDLRILRSYDLCDAAPLHLQKNEGLMKISLSKYGSQRKFACAVPLLKEDGKWRMTRHWAPMDTYRSRLKSLRSELKLKFEDMQRMPNETYTKTAKAAMRDYFDKLNRLNETLKTAGGGSLPPFCHGPLNLAEGRDLAYQYLIFHEKLQGKPSDLIQATKRRRQFVDDLRSGYDVLASKVQKGVRIDLIRTGGVKRKDESGRIRQMVQCRLMFWGNFHPPLQWKLNLYEKGEVAQEGYGKQVEILSDAHRFVFEAPHMNLGILHFTLVPAYAERLELVFTEADETTQYRIDVPITKEMRKQAP